MFSRAVLHEVFSGGAVMRSGRTARVRFDILAVTLVLGALLPIAWEQTGSIPGPPVASETESPLTPGVGESNAELIVFTLGIAVLVLVVVVVADAIDGRPKREDDAVRLQAQISDALLHDRTLASLPVAPTVHIPLWWRSPPRVEMGGQVPTAELREAVLHVAEQEASRILEVYHLHDRIVVVPSVGARAA